MQIAQKNFYKKLLGRIGEKKAAEYLIKKGYKVIDRNYKTHIGEIDIIAKDGETVVFVEVKTRESDRFGAPSEAVNYEKQKKYYAVANEYISRNGITEKPCRFDVVEIAEGKINHIEDAFSM